MKVDDFIAEIEKENYMSKMKHHIKIIGGSNDYSNRNSGPYHSTKPGAFDIQAKKIFGIRQFSPESYKTKSSSLKSLPKMPSKERASILEQNKKLMIKL